MSMQSKVSLSKRGTISVNETLNSPNPQKGKLTEGNLDVFKASVADANVVMRSPTALDAVSSINSQYVSNRLKKYTEQLLNNPGTNLWKLTDTLSSATPKPSALPTASPLSLQPIQYDYLKRFIKNLEEETLAMHREAKQRRVLNEQYDARMAREAAKRAMQRTSYKESIEEQLKGNAARRHDENVRESMVPHIVGD